MFFSEFSLSIIVIIDILFKKVKRRLTIFVAYENDYTLVPCVKINVWCRYL